MLTHVDPPPDYELRAGIFPVREVRFLQKIDRHILVLRNPHLCAIPALHLHHALIGVSGLDRVRILPAASAEQQGSQTTYDCFFSHRFCYSADKVDILWGLRCFPRYDGFYILVIQDSF